MARTLARKKPRRDTRSRQSIETQRPSRAPRPGFWKGLRDETRNSIIGILFFIIGIVLLGAAWGPGGFLGEKLYLGVHFLFGIGYYLLPLLSFILGWNFFRAGGHNLPTPSLVASPFFVTSSLGLLSLWNLSPALTGGFIGTYVAKPMVILFAPVLAGVILLAVFVIAILMLFDMPLRLGFLFGFLEYLKRAKHDADEEIDDAQFAGADEDDEEGEVEVIDLKAEADRTRAIQEEEQAEKEAEGPAEPRIAEPITNAARKGAAGATFRFNQIAHREYVAPPLSLLANDKGKPGYGDIKANANIIKRTLANFGIEVEMDEVSIGPSITRYALKPAEGVRLSKITALQHDLELALAAAPIRIEAPIPGKSLVGIEMPNSVKSTVGLGTLLSDPEWAGSPNPLFVPLGKGISGIAQFMNITKMPHVLVAGATGSGKSVTIHNIITSLLYRNSPEQLRFIMIDPKRVELTLYNGIPHLLTPVITEAKKTILTLKWATKEMDRRYDLLQETKSRDIHSYHQNILSPALEKYDKQYAGRDDDEAHAAEDALPELMPYIVIIIDELADLMQAYPRELESAIVRLAQMSRAVGIHLVLSTQRPSVNVITGLIKANIPARIALQVASQIDSRTILDMAGAENLLGAGDMLYLSAEMPKPVRLQSAFISENEVKTVVKFLKDHYDGTLGDELVVGGQEGSGPSSIFGTIEVGSSDDSEDDEKYEEAKRLVIESQRASTSFLQRRLGLGYARAARMVDLLEERGVVGPGDGAKPRDVLMRPGDTDV
ncbi:MAG TPA: DNA translocase FtsK 4TM domain-containing protein [Candidatus Paceibacterota bacterium]|nr:DNA translocase FtsK 4TM domain-containing protein [Candidatus Paceibacterota bacterium]